MKKPRYIFENVICTNIVDGDTADIKIDFGFKLEQVIRIRLNRINTPEVRGKEREEGLRAKRYVNDRIYGKRVRIETSKKGKYGRYLAEVYINGRNLNDELVKKGFAEYRNY